MESGYQRKSYRFGSSVGPTIKTIKTTKGQYREPEKRKKIDPNKRKENSFSIFFVTINTNMNYSSKIPEKNLRLQASREEAADKLANAIDNLFGSDPGAGGNCDFLEFFKLPPNTFPVYANDDKDYEEWCGRFKELWVKGTTEWSNKSKSRTFLHAHAIIKVVHSTMIHLNKDAIAQYIKAEMGMPHLPYIHIDMVNDGFYQLINYIQKDVEDPVGNIDPGDITDDVMDKLVSQMENLKGKYH